MKTTEFDYELPEKFIAQEPQESRIESKLLILNRQFGEVTHKHFYDIIDELEKGDVLVLNKTRVFPARLYGKKVGGSSQIEVLLLNQISNNEWVALIKPGKRLKIGSKISFGEDILLGEIVQDNGRTRNIKFEFEGSFHEILDSIGEIPLPPYIHNKLKDNERYQTVFGTEIGSAAAPTAGLHFSDELLQMCRNKGIKIVEVLLHVGIGTFLPVQAEDILDHDMHYEYFEVSKEAADIINTAKSQQNRIIAVGTTVVRTLESIAKNGLVCEGNGWTNIFIYPGYKFKVIDAMITNFHLPKSSLIMLVSAFADKNFIMEAYQIAKENNYRFFSFGDAMFIQ